MFLPSPPHSGETISCFHLRSVKKPKTVGILYLGREVACITPMKGTDFSLDPVMFHCVEGLELHLGSPLLIPACLPAQGNQTDSSSQWFPSRGFSMITISQRDCSSFHQFSFLGGGIPSATSWPPPDCLHFLVFRVHTALFPQPPFLGRSHPPALLLPWWHRRPCLPTSSVSCQPQMTFWHPSTL